MAFEVTLYGPETQNSVRVNRPDAVGLLKALSVRIGLKSHCHKYNCTRPGVIFFAFALASSAV